MSILGGVVIGSLGAVLLEYLFRLISDRWPEGYDSSIRMIDRAPRYGLIRYTAFRFCPTFIVGVLVIVTTERLESSVLAAAVSLLLLYVVLRDIRAAIDAIKRADPRIGVLRFLYAYNILIVILAVGTALISRSVAARVVPDPRELLTSLWTAVFVAIFAFMIQRLFEVSSSNSPSLEEDILHLGTELKEYVENSAIKFDCSPELILSIVLMENRQRPAWFRNCERLAGAMLPGRPLTYGVGQIRSTRPITDEQSVDELCKAFAHFYPGRIGYDDSLPLRLKLAKHNPDGIFVRGVVEIYRELVPKVVSFSSELAYDGRPTMEVYFPKYRRSTMEISGSYCGPVADHSWCLGAENESGVLSNIEVNETTSRKRFSYLLAPEFCDLFLLCDGKEIGHRFSLDDCSALPW